MRQLFLVLAKIVGLLQVFAAVNVLAQTTMMVSTAAAISGGKGLWDIRFPLGLFTLYFFLCASFAWALLFQTERLASRVGIRDGEPIVSIEKSLLLWIGGTLVGLFLVVESGGELFTEVAPRLSDSFRTSSGGWLGLLPSAAKLCLSLILVFRMKTISEWLMAKQK